MTLEFFHEHPRCHHYHASLQGQLPFEFWLKNINKYLPLVSLEILGYLVLLSKREVNKEGK